MALNQAIYSVGWDKIFAVRGGWIYQFNATTGLVEASSRFANALGCEGTITELGSKLYAAAWRGIIEDPTNNPVDFRADRDIYEINPATLLGVPLGVYTNLSTNFTNSQFPAGFSRLVADNTVDLFGIESNNALFTVNPGDPIGTYAATSFDPGMSWNDVCWDQTNGVLWVTDQYGVDIYGYNLLGGGSSHTTPSALVPPPFGLCFSPPNVKVYAVTGSQRVIKANVNETIPTLAANFTWSNLDILHIDAKPVRIKYNPNDGLIYIPTWTHDTVEVLNPNTDTITAIKTGFSSPIDVVFTPSKKWAVQDSAIGLREIT